MTFALTSLLSSITILIPVLSDSSLRAVIPSILLFFTRSPILPIRRSLLTMYGISVTTILFLPLSIGSISVTARTIIFPLPVLCACSMPERPLMMAPVGKSGPFTISITSSIVVSASFSTMLSMIFTTAPITSPKL